MPPSVNHSLLETVESAFQALSAGPDPLTVDGAILGQGLPSAASGALSPGVDSGWWAH